MRIFYLILLSLLAGFILSDLAYVFARWELFNEFNLAPHLVFIVGASITCGLNVCYLLFRTPLYFEVHLRLLASLLGQVASLCTVSLTLPACYRVLAYNREALGSNALLTVVTTLFFLASVAFFIFLGWSFRLSSAKKPEAESKKHAPNPLRG